MSNTYAIDFQNPKSGERRTIIVKETAAEAECARIRRFWAVHQSMQQRALDQLPAGFEHVLGSLQQVTAN
jgi:hypothetical protein